MGIAYNVAIVRDNLVLCLDAANPKNYNLTEVEVLVVAGGGGGGAGTAGGGGGGGVIYNRNFAVTPGSALTVTVGAGGAGKVYAVSNTAGDNGGNSVFGALTSIGGGGGGNRDSSEVGKNGGSGGGGGGAEGGVNGAGTGTSGQGFAGGIGRGGGGGSAGGGGGGAGEVGQSSPSTGLGGNGGNGLGFNISGTFTYYGGGGGGGSHTGRSSGGIGGGGAGSENGPTYNAVAGTTNTGGGGGGGGGAAGGQFGGNGGSGIVIVRYQGPQKAIGGTITSNSGYTIHTFTTSSTFTPLVATNNSAILGLSDFSGGGNFATSVNGPTYSSANGGSIVFDGTNDYVDTGKTATQLGVYDADYTFDAWVYPTNLDSDKTMFGTDQTALRQGLHLVFRSGAIYQGHYSADFSAGSATLNAWNNISYTYVKSSSSASIYKNGVLQGSGTIASFIGTTNILIGRWASTYYFSGNGSNYKVYNRALSAAEIQQNFNATRSRFSI